LYADLPQRVEGRPCISVEAGTLTIEAELGVAAEGSAGDAYRSGLGRYRRAFTLSKELDTDKVSATLEPTMLTLRIPKAAHAQPRRIQVQS
jgi:HSP20 family molecular chaperone IbpA